ncbi:MAG: hypothetical protein K8R59_00620 [Thermoanaerobaculales bacterium]|nr:hypothetical protein [Thermoanaerobaculales bacterium]
MFSRQVTVLVGHFGSGKTEIALNGALDLAARGERVTLADLDVVKPYFRARSARFILAEAGVDLIAPEGENVYADLPIIVPRVRDVLRRPQGKVILDVGGDGTGARVLGSITDVLPKTGMNVLVVVNFSRPSTPDPAGAVAMVREIERVSRVRVTGLISNTHMLEETTPEIVVSGAEQAVRAGNELGLPVVASAVHQDMASSVNGALPCSIFVLNRIVKPPFEVQPQRRTMGPLFVLN